MHTIEHRKNEFWNHDWVSMTVQKVYQDWYWYWLIRWSDKTDPRYCAVYSLYCIVLTKVCLFVSAVQKSDFCDLYRNFGWGEFFCVFLVTKSSSDIRVPFSTVDSTSDMDYYYERMWD